MFGPQVPEDMDEPLGVIYLFNSRLSPASDSNNGRKAVRSKFPHAHVESGFCLITPHRTYQLYADSPEEAAAWRAVLTQMQDLMVGATDCAVLCLSLHAMIVPQESPSCGVISSRFSPLCFST